MGDRPRGSVPAAELIDFTIITLKKRAGTWTQAVQTTPLRALRRATVEEALRAAGFTSVQMLRKLCHDSLRLSRCCRPGGSCQEVALTSFRYTHSSESTFPPSMETITAFSGTFRLAACRACCAMARSPRQQGTCIMSTVSVLICAWSIIAVIFSR